MEGGILDFGGLRNVWGYEEVEAVDIDNSLEKFGSEEQGKGGSRGRVEIQRNFFFSSSFFLNLGGLRCL